LKNKQIENLKIGIILNNPDLPNFLKIDNVDWSSEPNPVKKDDSQNQKYVNNNNNTQKKNKT
jgi:hypothetical protein